MSQIAFSPAPSSLSEPSSLSLEETTTAHPQPRDRYIRRAAVSIKSHIFPEIWWMCASCFSPEVLRLLGAGDGFFLTACQRERKTALHFYRLEYLELRPCATVSPRRIRRTGAAQTLSHIIPDALALAARFCERCANGRVNTAFWYSELSGEVQRERERQKQVSIFRLLHIAYPNMLSKQSAY